MCADTERLAEVVVALRVAHPSLNVVQLCQRYPKVLTLSPQQIKEDAVKVCACAPLELSRDLVVHALVPSV